MANKNNRLAMIFRVYSFSLACMIFLNTTYQQRKRRITIYCVLFLIYKGKMASNSCLLNAVARREEKKKGDNQKGGDQNRYRPFTTPNH